MRAIFFIGSIRERMVCRHHSSRNFPAQVGEVYSQSLLEVFFEQIGPDGPQIVVEEVSQAEPLRGGEVVFSLQQAPAGLFQ